MSLSKITLALCTLGLLAITSLLLSACSTDTLMLSSVTISPSAQPLVPGSSGIGKPPGAIEVHYALGTAGQVQINLDGPVSATLFSDSQEAGPHVLRFTGVITAQDTLNDSKLVRKVIPDGDYTITVSTGTTHDTARFSVKGADAQPPSLGNILVHPDTISPNSDAVDDVSEVTFRTNQTSTLSLDLTRSDGTRSLVLAPIQKGPGEQNVVINGQDLAGNVLPDGTYTVTVRAQDRAGNRIETQRPFKIENGGKPALEVLRVDITPQQIILGQAISVSITIKNSGKVPLRTQGPDVGYTYTTNDTYASIEGNKWTDKPGLWRVGVDWDGNSGGGGAYRYPFRWGFGKTLMPGETVTTGGKIIILKQERKMSFFAGVLQEGVRIVFDLLGRTLIGIDF